MLQKMEFIVMFSYPGDMLTSALPKLTILTKCSVKKNKILISPSTCDRFCRIALKWRMPSIRCDRCDHLEMFWISFPCSSAVFLICAQQGYRADLQWRCPKLREQWEPADGKGRERGWPCPLAGRRCSPGAALCQPAWEKIWLLVIPGADTWESCPPSSLLFLLSTSRVWEGVNEGRGGTWGKCEKWVKLSESLRYSPRLIPPVRKGVDFWIPACLVRVYYFYAGE